MGVKPDVGHQIRKKKRHGEKERERERERVEKREGNAGRAMKRGGKEDARSLEKNDISDVRFT